MKNSWLVWFAVAGALITVLVALNYDGGQGTVPLTEIFPDEQARGIEYEFVETGGESAALGDNAAAKKDRAAGGDLKAASVQKASGIFSGQTSVAPQKVQTLPSALVSVSPHAVAASGSKTFTIQVASFKDKVRAEKALNQAQERGYSAYIDSQSRESGGFWYRVCIGKFNVQEEAKNLLIKVRQDYKDGFIKTLQNF